MTNRFSELTQDIQDRIREIAYLMWESAGRQHGMAMEYWLSAEQEVLSTLQAAAHRMLPDLDVRTKAPKESATAKLGSAGLEAARHRSRTVASGRETRCSPGRPRQSKSLDFLNDLADRRQRDGVTTRAL